MDVFEGAAGSCRSAGLFYEDLVPEPDPERFADGVLERLVELKREYLRSRNTWLLWQSIRVCHLHSIPPPAWVLEAAPKPPANRLRASWARAFKLRVLPRMATLAGVSRRKAADVLATRAPKWLKGSSRGWLPR